MREGWLASIATLLALAGSSGLVAYGAQQAVDQSMSVADRQAAVKSPRQRPVTDPTTNEFAVEHAECPYFGPGSEKYAPKFAAESNSGGLTRQFAQYSSHTRTNETYAEPFQSAATGTGNPIDKFIYADLQANGIKPAGKTNDYEFVRRVYLDLTGRIPRADLVQNFVFSVDPDKRAKLIDQLLATTQWVDKWTMYYGDLFQNTAGNVQVNRRAEGRNAFYKWIHDSLANAKPYNQMATELIAAQGTNSFDQSQGQINWLAGYVVGGGPAQDIFDSQAAAVASTFLGNTHVNCLLCHSGRGHLDSLSLWASQATRTQAWGFTSFLSHTNTQRMNTPPDPNNKNSMVQYFALGKYTADYTLNTTTGNRPSRQPIGTLKNIAPTYMFGGGSPASGEDYRAALARYTTTDFQFARAAVNYVWAQYFGRGIVDPPDQFDPLRLDPDKPPPAPWTLQPSNARLLNALAQNFIDNNYDLRGLMRLIATSDTYQLTSHYDGQWNAAWEPYFARKMVRRLWPEELHDSIVTVTGILPAYTVPGFSTDSTIYGVSSPGFGKISYAMQAPEVVNMPDGGGSVSQFMDTFLRGNRDDQPRKQEGSILQTLGLMNDNFIQSRIHATAATSTAPPSFLQSMIGLPDTQLVDTLFLTVLSRHPDATELKTALTYLQGGASNARKTNAEDLLWSLFNKVDFIFNY